MISQDRTEQRRGGDGGRDMPCEHDMVWVFITHQCDTHHNRHVYDYKKNI